jgi:hypothetical protein
MPKALASNDTRALFVAGAGLEHYDMWRNPEISRVLVTQ